MLAFLVAVPVALLPPSSFDLPFHLAAGRWWLAHGFPDRDPFSFTADRAWFPHEWAFGVAAELSVRALGAAGPQLIVAALLVLLCRLVWTSLGPRSERGALAILAFFLVLSTQANTWEEARPYHAGHVLFAATVLLVQRWRGGIPWAAWAIVPITIVWANVHGSWALGPVLLGATAVGRFLDGDRKPALSGGGAAIVAWLASSISPGGLRTIVYPIELMTTASTATIQEWAPLQFDGAMGRSVVALMVLTAWFAFRSPSRSWTLLLPAIGLAAASFKAQRHAPMAAILLAPAIVELARGVSRGADTAWSRAVSLLDTPLRAWSRSANGSVWSVIAISILVIAAARHPHPFADALPRDLYPMTALEALRSSPPGRVIARYRWGGAVSYLAGPEYPVFIDGRNDPFPKAIHDDYETLVLLKPGWEDVLARHRPRYLLWGAVNHGEALMQALRGRPEWRVVAADETGTLYEHVGAARPAE